MVAEKVFVTPEEYLRLERAAEFRSEYVNGEIIPMGRDLPDIMAGATTNHNRVKENLTGEFYIHFKSNKRCRSYSSNQRVNVPTDSLYAYPDVVVVCGPNEYHSELHDTLTNPALIIEVLSPGKAAFDRGEKFALYRQSVSLQEYVLIDSEKIRVDVFRKHEQGYWFLASEADKPDEAIELATIRLKLALSDVYAETEGILSKII